MTEETLASSPDGAVDEEHVRRNRCIRNCGSGLREGYATAWTEAARDDRDGGELSVESYLNRKIHAIYL